jgi:transposase InsO family protein
MKRGNRGGPAQCQTKAGHTVGVNIGFDDGTSPGGYKYCLFLVDLATRYTWTYGLSDLTGDSITDALWQYFVDAGGFPHRLRCDFDRRFRHGLVSQLLCAHGVRIGASPPHRQLQNGAVKRNWNTAVEMGPAYLTKAGLLKRYWFWAVREATICMNMLPVKAGICTGDEGAFNDLPPTANRTGTPPFLEFGNLAQVGKTAPPNPTPPTQTKKKNSQKSLSDRAAQLATPLELFYGV